MKWLWSNKFINGPVVTTPHSLLPTYACILEMNPRKRAREERDSKRASARDIKREGRPVPRLWRRQPRPPAAAMLSIPYVPPGRQRKEEWPRAVA